jgi:4-amino-4-deoxy-L-arabinose transferase-like glycosyltransferase
LGEQYDLITPPEIIWLGRLMVAALSVGTVIVAGELARLLGGARAGILAMLLVALCPALVSRASNLVIDTTASFFALLALYFCQRLRLQAGSPSRRLWVYAILAGASSGLAFAGKFTAGAVFAAVLVTIVTLSFEWSRKAILFSIAGAGLFAGVFCGVPGAILHPAKILGELRYISNFYSTVQTDHNYWITAWSRWELGIPLMIVGLVGLVWMLRSAATRMVALSWIAFGALLVSAVVWSSFQPFRNVLSLVPPFCIAAALFLVRAGDYFEKRLGRGSLSLWFVAGLIALVASSLGWFSLLHLERRATSTDTRIRAIDWLQQHSTKEQAVLGIRELAILPAEWKRIAASSVVVPWFEAADLLGQRRFDYVVTGEFSLSYAPDPNSWSAYLERWKASVAGLPVEKDFGQVVTPVVPYLWRTNDERILILKGNVP